MNIDILVVGDLETNCYILSIDDKCLIIDPGAEENEIIKAVNESELKVLGILVTHNHYDHDTYAKSLSEFYGVDVYNNTNLFEKEHHIGPFNFYVIYTPGHSDTEITFYFKEYNVMFDGDFIFKNSIGRVDLPGGSFVDMTQSIEKIKQYNDEIVLYPGHGDSTTLGYEKKNNYYFR